MGGIGRCSNSADLKKIGTITSPKTPKATAVFRRQYLGSDHHPPDGLHTSLNRPAWSPCPPPMSRVSQASCRTHAWKATGGLRKPQLGLPAPTDRKRSACSRGRRSTHCCTSFLPRLGRCRRRLLLVRRSSHKHVTGVRASMEPFRCVDTFDRMALNPNDRPTNSHTSLSKAECEPSRTLGYSAGRGDPALMKLERQVQATNLRNMEGTSEQEWKQTYHRAN